MKKFFSNKTFLSGMFLLILGSVTVWSLWGINHLTTDQGEIKTREDGQYVYYDVMLNHVKPSNLAVNVADGKILISGLLQIQNKVDGQVQGFVAPYEKVIPAPGHVNTSQYDVAQARGKLILRFKKSKSS